MVPVDQPWVSTITGVRHSFLHSGRRLSYLDFGGPGRPVLALHGHYNEAAAFAPLAAALSPDLRVLALDQRGHGESDRADSYGREDYVEDVAAFHDHLGLGPLPVVGHSLGGVNAYQYAARHPGHTRHRAQHSPTSASTGPEHDVGVKVGAGLRMEVA